MKRLTRRTGIGAGIGTGIGAGIAAGLLLLAAGTATARAGAAAAAAAGTAVGEALRRELTKEIGAVGDAVRTDRWGPGTLLVAGEKSFPLVMGVIKKKTPAPVAAVCGIGGGRAAAFAHAAFFGKGALKEGGPDARLMRRLAGWLCGGRETPALFIDEQFRADGLSALPGVRVSKFLRKKMTLDGLPAGSVYVFNADRLRPEEVEGVRRFAARGGGLLCTVSAAGRSTWNKGKLIAQHPFNLLLGPSGLYVSDQGSDRPQEGGYRLPKRMSNMNRLCDMLDALEQGRQIYGAGDCLQCFHYLTTAPALLPPGSPLAKRIEALAGLEGTTAPTPSKPLRPGDIRTRFAYERFQRKWLADPLRVWPAHPAAATYPGIPAKGSARVTRTVAVDLSVPRWHGTGLFAAAGEPVTFTFPEGAETLGLAVRIGSTHCRLKMQGNLSRAPVVTVQAPVKRRVMTFSSPFGGMIYVVVPNRAPKNGGTAPAAPAPGVIAVTIGPACPAPWYRHGRDTPAAWREKIRGLPAPYAEIEGKKIIFTVPSSLIRTMDDPEPAIKVWEEVLDLDAKLTAIPKERKSAERFVADVQLCAGYMHAGYPIMVPVSAAKNLISADFIRDGKKAWGFFHEMGHNHQYSDWTFQGTIEVTVNLFTLYNMERLCGIKPRETRMGSENQKRAVKRWEDNGRKYDEWKKNAFVALEFFLRIQEKYGWETYEKLFAEYRTLKPEERPKNDLEKRRQLAERLSRITGDDLFPYFREWNVLP